VTALNPSPAPGCGLERAWSERPGDGRSARFLWLG
jgi:hypothetical protein